MFDKIKLPLAKSKKSKFNLRNHVIATGEMGQLFPIRQIEVVPDDDFTIDVEMFSRTAPLVVPTFGSVKFTTRAFYVPSRLLYPYWNEFITGKNVYIDGQPTEPSIPYITSYELINLFANNANGLVVEGSSNTYDFIYYDSGQPSYKLFTNKGRYWLKVLYSLGYKFNFVDEANPSESGSNNIKYSLLPLLAYLRVYMDFYLPSQYLENSLITQFFNELKSTTNRSDYISQIYEVLDSIQLAYDNDYFTSAWRYPLSLLSNNVSQEARQDKLSYLTEGYNLSEITEGSPARTYSRYAINDVTSNTSPSTTNWAITMAQKLANYMIRNNYAGSRAVEQILARFGVRVPDMEIQRAIHFGTSESSLQIMDITNVAESENAPLGSYGAKAIGYDNGRKMHIHCKEHGFIILLSSIMPETSMGFQGFDRDLMHLNKFDFFTPEFDKSIMQPVYSGELVSDFMANSFESDLPTWAQIKSRNAKPSDIFGFVPYGTEYKVAHDNVIGDFTIPHLKQGLDCYHLFRQIVVDTNLLAQNPDITYFNGEQYNRIFNVTDQNQDHFYMIFRIKVSAERPMLSISESVPFNDDDIEHRNRVEMRPNGSQYNK